MHNMVCGWCQKKFHLESQCYAKKNGEAKVEPVKKVTDNKKKAGGGKKNPDDISKKEKKFQKKKKSVKSVKSDVSAKTENEEDDEDEMESEEEETANSAGKVKSVRSFVRGTTNAQLTCGNRFEKTGGSQLLGRGAAAAFLTKSNVDTFLSDGTSSSSSGEMGDGQEEETETSKWENQWNWIYCTTSCAKNSKI